MVCARRFEAQSGRGGRARRGVAPLAAVVVAAAVGCTRGSPPPRDATAEALAAVAAVHGAAGPFAVAGWRMGARALRELGVPRGHFPLEVEHRSPARVSESCIADGWQAVTGTSVGRMSLRRVEAPEGATATRIRDRASGRSLVFELTPAFRARFAHVTHANAEALGREVSALADEDIFTLHPDTDPWP
jgi:formylmethanofuran dehydrogenase subunit E